MPLESPLHAWALPPAQTQSLSERIGALHMHLRGVAPAVDRMACALYDPAEDLLKTFVNSSLGGEPLRAYQYRLSDSPSLGTLARERRSRVIDHLDRLPASDTAHSHWLREQGYRSSYTVPIFDGDSFEGFLFFDSLRPEAFTLHGWRRGIHSDQARATSIPSLGAESLARRGLTAVATSSRSFQGPPRSRPAGSSRRPFRPPRCW